MIVEVLVEDGDIIGACARWELESERMSGRPLLFGAGREIVEASVCGEKTIVANDAMPAA